MSESKPAPEPRQRAPELGAVLTLLRAEMRKPTHLYDHVRPELAAVYRWLEEIDRKGGRINVTDF